jgi:N-acetylmuramoyl-L-alanine amidase
MADNTFELQDTQPIGQGDHVVEQGESIYSIACATGHVWETIWQHDKNQELRNARTPGTLLPGDKVFVPPIKHKTAIAYTDRCNRFVVKNRMIDFRVKLFDADGEPLGDEPFTFVVNNRCIQGNTDSDGVVTARISANATNGKLTLDRTGECYDLCFGYLDPPNSVAGVQARLNNLGFSCGEVDGNAGPFTREAWLAFLQEIGENEDANPAIVQERLGKENPWK